MQGAGQEMLGIFIKSVVYGGAAYVVSLVKNFLFGCNL